MNNFKLANICIEILQFFAEYGSLAAKVRVNTTKVKPFQKLLFLVRDWFNPHQSPYGLRGGRQFLEKVLTVSNIFLRWSY